MDAVVFWVVIVVLCVVCLWTIFRVATAFESFANPKPVRARPRLSMIVGVDGERLIVDHPEAPSFHCKPNPGVSITKDRAI